MCPYGLAALLLCVIVAGCKPPSNGPEAEFSADTTTGIAPPGVQFTDLSDPGKSAITSWHRLFGDGGESTLQNPQHVYTTPGHRNLSLEVTTAAGSDTELKLNHITVTTPSVEGEDEGERGTETVMLPGNVPLVDRKSTRLNSSH